jgi:predicted DNA-binding transcriptional regulator AlpA
MLKPRAKRPASQPVLPAEGYVREAQLLGCKRRGWLPILPLSRTGLRLWIRDGRWPAPRKLGPKFCAWDVSTVREALEGMRITDTMEVTK